MAAGEAVDGVRNGTAAAAARLGVLELLAEFEHEKRIQDAAFILLGEATSEEQDQARDDVRAALAALPMGATDREIARTKEGALQSVRAVIAARKKREDLIATGLREVYRYAREMLREYPGHYDKFASPLSIELRCRTVEGALRREVKGDEDDVRELVHMEMERLEGIEED
jgi:hypothetical protein